MSTERALTITIDARAAAEQVARYLADWSGAEVTVSRDGTFVGRSRGRCAAWPIGGGIVDDGGEVMVCARIGLLEAQGAVLVDARTLLRTVAHLGQRARLAAADEGTLAAELRLAPTPLGAVRLAVLAKEVEQLDALARQLAEALPPRTPDELVRAWATLGGEASPVLPWAPTGGWSAELEGWARAAAELLLGGCSVALVAPRAAGGCALAALAGALLPGGGSLGRLLRPTLPLRALVELARKAPGILVVPSTALSLGASPYEVSDEAGATLDALAELGRAVVFVGSLEELQRVFHGGQGGAADPLRPAVLHVPGILEAVLVEGAIASEGERVGGLAPAAAALAREAVTDALAPLSSQQAERVLSLTSRRAVGQALGGTGGSLEAFSRQVLGCSETLGGLGPRRRVERPAELEARWVRVLADEGLPAALGEHVLGQEEPVRRLCDHLRGEVLTRARWEPLRALLIGAPGTGKSSLARELARLLGAAHVPVDAAGFSDPHQAASQLVGQARGIVHSHKAGRIEEAARHPAGTVLEIADLDHAPPAVRAQIGDIFLPLLDTGEVQTGTGALVACGRLIVVYTMNLPDGADERLTRKGFGFAGAPGVDEVRARALDALRGVVTAAFLSRAGEPIVLPPLSVATRALIAERAIADAVTLAARRLGLGTPAVEVDEELGARLAQASALHAGTMGTRAILAAARNEVARALSALRGSGEVTRVVASSGPDGRIRVDVR